MIKGLVKWMWGFVTLANESSQKTEQMSEKDAVMVIEKYYLDYKTKLRKTNRSIYLMNIDVDAIKKSVTTFENNLNNPRKSSKKRRKKNKH